MRETTKEGMAYRAAVMELLRACERFEDLFHWDSSQGGYVDHGDEKAFDEACAGAARIAEPFADEVPDAARDRLRALLRACREFTARFSDDTGGKAYIPEQPEERWRTARREARKFLAT
jgi:hypothetical protein